VATAAPISTLSQNVCKRAVAAGVQVLGIVHGPVPYAPLILSLVRPLSIRSDLSVSAPEVRSNVVRFPGSAGAGRPGGRS
jgi:hypothetical protein